MPRFFVEAGLLGSPEILLSKEESRHAIRILRLKNGDVVDIFDGKGGEYRAIVTGASGGRLALTLDRSQKKDSQKNKKVLEITVAVSVIKPEAMDVLIQKACELGASRIAPPLVDPAFLIAAASMNTAVSTPSRITATNAKAAIHDTVRELADSGIAICVTSSDLEELLDVADRIVCMRRGRIVADRPSEVFDKLGLLALASTDPDP